MASGILCIVPARGGSKRLPRKNVLSLGNKPLVQWALEAGVGASEVNETCLSSDDEEILAVSTRIQGVVALPRPSELATDTATTVDVVMHALEEMARRRGIPYEGVVLLQPTSPFTTAADVDAAIKKWRSSGKGSVVSVCEAMHSPIWSNTLPEDLAMDGFIPDRWQRIRSQDLPAFYRLNGAVYVAEVKGFARERGFLWPKGTYAYIMPPERSVDIDTWIDFEFAEFLIQKRGPDNSG